MNENEVIALDPPGGVERGALTEVLRQGAWRMLARTVAAEVEAFVAAHGHFRHEEGRRHVFGNDGLPGRTVRTGIGNIAVEAPRVPNWSGADLR